MLEFNPEKIICIVVELKIVIQGWNAWEVKLEHMQVLSAEV